MRKGVGIEKKAYFCNGIEDAESDKVQVYTRDGRIVVDSADGETVRVYDIMGRQQSSFTSHLSPFTFPSGVYMVKIGNRSAQKVTVIR